MIDFTNYEVLSFDCYGTLIDWESGILGALKPVLSAHQIHLDDRQILELYGEIESKAEEGDYLRYREILKNVVRQFGRRFNFTPTPSEVACLVDSLRNWKPFPDTVGALQALRKKFKLAVISNIDDDLFALSAKRLQVELDWVITAEQAKSYKPSLHNFELALQRIGVPPKKLLHVAQSLYHDIVPAKTLGLSTVWVNRRKDKEGFGATPPASGHPDLEVPDLKTLASTLGLNAEGPTA